MRLVFCVAVTLGLAAAASAAAPAAVGMDPRIVEAIHKVKPADYPSANSVTIVNDQAVVYQADGTFTNTMHTVRLVLANDGKAEASATSIHYTKDAEKEEVLLAQVIKPDGQAIPVGPSDIQDVEEEGDANIYDPQGRAIKITFPGLAVGDAVEVSHKLTRHLPTRPNYWNDVFSFQSTEPVVSATYTVDGPASRPLVAEIYHPERGAKITATKQAMGDRIHYTWTARNAPQLVPETAMDFSTEVPMLVVTTDPSWQDFSKWWADVTRPQMELTPALTTKVKELVLGKQTDADKIKALFDFVSADIRYRGLGVGPRTGYTPRKASETYTSRWGVCRDVSILLTTMLRAEGFDAYPVLTNVGDPVLPKIAYDGFNHAIVALKNKAGGWTYLDPTAKNMHDLLPGHEAEQSTLIASARGEGLSAIPAADPAKNLGHAIAQSAINADGSLTSKVTLETTGMFDLVVRSTAAMMSPDQQRETIEELVHHALPDATLVSYEVSSALALFDPMKITLEIKVPNAAVKAGDHLLLRTLVTSGALGLVEGVMPRVLGGAPSRKYTLDAHVTFQYDQDETITLGKGMKVVALPNPARASNKVSTLDAACTQNDAATITCHRSFALHSRFIEPAAYDGLRGVIATLGRIAHQPVILTGAP